MKTKFIFGLAFVIVLILTGCQSKQQQSFDEELEKKKILDLLALNNKFLQNRDVSALKKCYSCSPDSEIYVAYGDLFYEKSPKLKTDDEILKILGNGHYTKIEELSPSIIRFSPDGKMAYQISKTKFIYEYTDSLGNTKIDEFIDAALAVYEKFDTCWSEVTIAQTFKNQKQK